MLGLLEKIVPAAVRQTAVTALLPLLAQGYPAFAVTANDSTARAGATLSGSHRLRYESLHNGPRITAAQSDEILVSRLLLSLTWRAQHLFGQFELQDSRAWLHGPRTPVGTDDVNALEPLQAWVGLRLGDAGNVDVRLGRMTKDLSTRRLVARNRFRNTLNAFEGVDLTASGDDLWVNAFAFRPVRREPLLPAPVRNNDIKLDRTSSGQLFTGVEIIPRDRQWSLHALGLYERDRAGFPTRNRRLVTVGGQWYSQQIASGWQHAGEVALQAGQSRLTLLPSDTQDLDHRALFAHAEVSRQWDGPWRSRLTLLADYASGDRVLGDGSNERFDTLFGARRFDYGPTGIYGIQARANMISPGLRWQARPGPDTGLMIGWRQFWLAEPLDQQAGTGFRQQPDRAQRDVGHQLETRLRQQAGDHLELELGAAWLDKGPVLQTDLHGNGGADTTYVYLQTTLTF